jgi:predicted ArsR family transcriptional regulator
MEENNIITLYELHPQEEIFCQYYLQTGSAGRSAFFSCMCNNIKENIKSYDDLTLRQQKDLSTMGNKALKKPAVRKRISQMAEAAAKAYSICGLDELLQYLTMVVRESKENIRNVPLANSAIKAIEMLLKRYPEFGSKGNNEAEKYNFSRFSKE